MASVLDQLISTDDSNPDMYMFKCGLCPKTVFSHLRRHVKEAQMEHKEKRDMTSASFVER
jgi:hypothetical protein